jgi:pyruvate dehydrogenase E2 component (dihydrolipoamide acetyltransferase)
MFGVKSFAPIILAPQAGALALGAIHDTVVPREGVVKEGEDNWRVSPIMVVTLSCDHRVVDGAVGAAWLGVFKGLVENPMTLLL